MTVLRSASVHLAEAEAETLWIEYETHKFPSIQSVRELAFYLFSTFFGNSKEVFGQSSLSIDPTLSPDATHVDDHEENMNTTIKGNSNKDSMNSKFSDDEVTNVYMQTEKVLGTPAIAIHTEVVREYWFATAVLPRLGDLPVARAIGSTKRSATHDALLLAARKCFPRILHHLLRAELALAGYASVILSESVVEELPSSTV
uniref:High-affinity zinc uptake system protein znuA n=1 Tax=Lygus hesperus TaxID=30085 RepID=A0A0A9X669_LYGHE